MSSLKEFAAGLRCVGRGFSFFASHRKLWWHAAIPTAINLLVLALLIFALAHYFGGLANWIFEEGGAEISSAGFFAKVRAAALGAVIFILRALLFIVILLFILIITFVISMIVSGPFNDILSERTEEIIGGRVETPFGLKPFIRGLGRTIAVELQKACFFLLIPLALLIVNLVPIAGSAFYFAAANAFAAFDIGFCFFDYPMSRRLYPFSKRLKLAWTFRYRIAGFGIVVLIPFFPYLFSAPLTVGGTLMFMEANPELKHPQEHRR